jgi:hypothetical protein
MLRPAAKRSARPGENLKAGAGNPDLSRTDPGIPSQAASANQFNPLLEVPLGPFSPHRKLM